jgi:hypothetical protein
VKVIEGQFGQEEDSAPPREILEEQLERSGLNTAEEGLYLMLWDTGDTYHMMSNLHSDQAALMMVEKARTTIMSAVFGGVLDNEGGS